MLCLDSSEMTFLFKNETLIHKRSFSSCRFFILSLFRTLSKRANNLVSKLEIGFKVTMVGLESSGLEIMQLVASLLLLV